MIGCGLHANPSLAVVASSIFDGISATYALSRDCFVTASDDEMNEFEQLVWRTISAAASTTCSTKFEQKVLQIGSASCGKLRGARCSR